MTLLELLPEEHIIVPLRAPDLRTAIRTLVNRMEATGAVESSDDLDGRIRNQPLRDVLTVSDDVVVPHYRTPAADQLVMALGVSPDPIPSPGSALDARPRVVAVVVGPQEAASRYLQAMSTLARVLRTPGLVDALVAQPDPAAVLDLPPLQEVRIQPSLTVRDVMAHRIRSVGPDATVRQALDLMLRHRLNSVPIVGEKREVLGLVTESDIMRALMPKIPRAGAEEVETDTEPAERSVREVMARSVLCVSEDLGVNEVASMMINKDVEQIPVVNAGAITGMVSRADIIRKLFGRS
ncbi:MAG: CBS domain-containing protein [Longimicrobiales bacterium]|nr:CBS domain-containing protein [Longimicrobiales bacterium]